MSKQKFELGEWAYVFKMRNDQPAKAFGMVKVAEINSGGYIQYTVDCPIKAPDGTDTMEQWLVNHASIAKTEQELDEKINNYMAYITAQKKIYEEKFGKPEFSKEYPNGK